MDCVVDNVEGNFSNLPGDFRLESSVSMEIRGLGSTTDYQTISSRMKISKLDLIFM